MDSDVPIGPSPSMDSATDASRRWIASFLRYLELRCKLVGLEAKEAGVHLLLLAILLTSGLVFLAGFLVMLVVFLLYLLMLIFHWEWGWSALACAGTLLMVSVIAGVLFRAQLRKPLFPTTFAELQKDREWLTHTTTNNG
jgi:uncharacterized membrane protein YqjE